MHLRVCHRYSRTTTPQTFEHHLGQGRCRIPQQRSLRLTLVFDLNPYQRRLEETPEEAAAEVVKPRPTYSRSHRLLTFLLGIPTRGPLGSRVSKFVQEIRRGHSYLMLAVTPEKSRQLDYIAATQTAMTPPDILLRIDGE